MHKVIDIAFIQEFTSGTIVGLSLFDHIFFLRENLMNLI
jgi:hypothetical protein